MSSDFCFLPPFFWGRRIRIGTSRTQDGLLTPRDGASRLEEFPRQRKPKAVKHRSNNRLHLRHLSPEPRVKGALRFSPVFPKCLPRMHDHKKGFPPHPRPTNRRHDRSTLLLSRRRLWSEYMTQIRLPAISVAVRRKSRRIRRSTTARFLSSFRAAVSRLRRCSTAADVRKKVGQSVLRMAHTPAPSAATANSSTTQLFAAREAPKR